MNLAVGKGSLQRAANAAGKGRKAKAADNDQVKMTAVTAGADDSQMKKIEAAENPVQQEVDAAKPKKVKKDTAKTTRKKSVKKQVTYLLTVPAETLQDIPQTWRGTKYVRPNVSALAESISKCGILEPIPAVQTGENTYQIVGGSKRMQVVQMLGIGQVPVLVLPGASMEDAWKLYQELNAAAEDGRVQRDWSAADEAQQTSGQKQQKNKIDAEKTDKQDKVSEVKKTSCSLFGKQRIPEYLL